jgi:hypothetical protein
MKTNNPIRRHIRALQKQTKNYKTNKPKNKAKQPFLFQEKNFNK